MPEAPQLGSPTSIGTHRDGRITVAFDWERAPDPIWLKAIEDLMVRSGRESVAATAQALTISFAPQAAEDALDDLAELLTDCDQLYHQDVEQRAAAVRHVQEALLERYGHGPDLPVRDV